jgi:hypothetical protein
MGKQNAVVAEKSTYGYKIHSLFWTLLRSALDTIPARFLLPNSTPPVAWKLLVQIPANAEVATANWGYLRSFLDLSPFL